METATDWFNDWRESYAGQSVVYIWPGVAEKTVANATLLKGNSQSDQIGIGIVSEQPAWLISASELVVDGDLKYPSTGDRIEATINGQSLVFEVAKPDDRRPCWVWSDPYHRIVKVFVKCDSFPDYVS